MISAVYIAKFASSRIVRLLVDAGAGTTSPAPLINGAGRVFFNDTALALATDIHTKSIEPITEDELHSLKATRRLLLRLAAVHAASWLWISGAPSFGRPAAEGQTWAQTTPVTLMLPILRQRTRRPRVLLAAMLRWVVSCDVAG